LLGCFAVVSLLATTSPAGAVAGYGDVADGQYYTEPVQWSADNNITGIEGNCFSPDAIVTRGEASVYMWNMQNQPTAPAHRFEDVTVEKQNAAVSWMSNTEITTGTSATTFAPDTALTRAQLVTFLWRLADEPRAPAHPFDDVQAEWQQGSVAWAAHREITTGTSSTTFAPDTTLTRAHLVTFLYRYQNKPDVTINPTSPQCATNPTFKTVTAGYTHACGVKADDTVTCWGYNRSGRSDAPEGEFTTVSAGGDHSCGVKVDSTVACWGYNGSGQADAPVGEFTTVTAGGDHSCGVKVDSTVACWGNNWLARSDAPEGEFTTVSAGGYRSCGVKVDSTVACWGGNGSGQADAPVGAFTTVSAGGSHSCGVKVDSTVACWGFNGSGQADAPEGEFTTVSAGGDHSCGVKVDSTVACWGFNGSGQADAPVGEFTTVSAGWRHSCGVKVDGKVACWGNNDYGQIEAPATNIVSGGDATHYNGAETYYRGGGYEEYILPALGYQSLYEQYPLAVQSRERCINDAAFTEFWTPEDCNVGLSRTAKVALWMGMDLDCVFSDASISGGDFAACPSPGNPNPTSSQPFMELCVSVMGSENADACASSARNLERSVAQAEEFGLDVEIIESWMPCLVHTTMAHLLRRIGHPELDPQHADITGINVGCDHY